MVFALRSKSLCLVIGIDINNDSIMGMNGRQGIRWIGGDETVRKGE